MNGLRRLNAVLRPFSVGLAAFACTLVLPWGVAVWGNEPHRLLWPTLLMLLLAMAVGLWLMAAGRARELRAREGFLLAALAWTLLPAAGAVPFMLFAEHGGIPPISWGQAYFEAVSGLTTTGSTVLVGLDTLPPSLHVWRATLMWLGGMGILVLAVAVLPLLGVGGSQVVRAETPGPMKDNKLTPRMTGTAKALYALYCGLSLACWLAYLGAGLTPLDAYVHMAATVSLGGFSSHDASFGAFDSLSVETVAVIFMLLSGINFATHFTAWRARSARAYLNCPEAPVFLSLTLGAALLVSLYLYLTGMYPELGQALRYGIFNTVSVATTTGFASTDYAVWPAAAIAIMVALSCFVSSSGSPGSGVKLIRVLLLLRLARFELRRLIHPHLVAPVQLNGRQVETRVLLGVAAFMGIFVALWFLLSLVLLLAGIEPVTALTAVLASLTNTGPGLGAVGPAGSYAGFAAFPLGICTLAMMLGRLELFTLLVLLTPTFWRR